MTSVSELAQQSKLRGWTPYQCPSCFSLFRAPGDRIGQIGKCPSCSANILLPQSDSAKNPSQPKPTPAGQPIVAKKAEIVEASDEADSSWKDQTHRRRRFGGNAERLDWEETETSSEKSIPWMAIVSTLTLIALGFAFYSYRTKTAPPPKAGRMPILIDQDVDFASVESSLALTVDEQQNEINDEATALIAKFATFELPKVSEAVANFLSAEDVETRAQFVRNADTVLPLMRAHYTNKEFNYGKFRSLEEGSISYRETFLSTSVRFKDFSTKPVAVEKTEDGYFVDWQSWVGYSEKSIQELMESRPTEPVEVRVEMQKRDYYNYHFSDDKFWASYRLNFPDDEGALWGYIKRDSELFENLKRKPSIPVILKIAYPKNARSSSQVQILERVTNGWVKGIK